MLAHNTFERLCAETFETVSREHQDRVELAGVPDVMDSKQLGSVIGTTAEALAQDRYLGIGIPYVIVGRRRVRYLKADVVRYLTENRRGGQGPTSDPQQ